MNEDAKTNKPVSAFVLWKPSVAAVRRNAKWFTLLYLLPLLSLFAGQSDRFNENEKEWLTGSAGAPGIGGYPLAALFAFGIVAFVIIVILSLIIQAMTYGLELEAAKGKTPSFKNLWAFGKKYWLRLFGLAIVVGLLIVGGLILLIVPGIIMLRRYFLSPYLMIDQDLKIGEAMKESARLSKPHSGAIYGIIGVMILFSLISIIPSIVTQVGSFIALVLYSVAPALRYQELKKLVGHETAAPGA